MSTRRAAHAGDNVHCRVGVAGSPQAGGLPVRAQWAPQLMKSRHLLAKEEPGSAEVVCRCFCRGIRTICVRGRLKAAKRQGSGVGSVWVFV